MITSCLCICGVAFWTLPSGIIGSGFALKVEQKKREKQFNRLVPAAASLIQNWWRMVAARRTHLTATWCIYRIEVERHSKLPRPHESPGTRPSPMEKMAWRRVCRAEDLDSSQRHGIRMMRVIKYHVAKRKFRQAHKPYSFKDIMDENAQGNMKVMYTLADIQRRLDQTLGLPKSYPMFQSDKDREQCTLNGKVQLLETKLVALEQQTNRVISLLERLCQQSKRQEARTTSRSAGLIEELGSDT